MLSINKKTIEIFKVILFTMINHDRNKECITTFSYSKVRNFQELVVNYYKREGRDFPWRNTKNPWNILLSEVLLRKTTAKQAAIIYKKISGFSIADFVNFDNEKLSEILKYLGMQNERARLLKKIAEQVNTHGISNLQDANFLDSLPGIGPYARNAVLCFAYNQPVPTLDRNMIRILQRVFSIKSDKSRPRTDKALWNIASIFVPLDFYKEYNWGILDISAAFCRPRKPKCDICPLNNICDLME